MDGTLKVSIPPALEVVGVEEQKDWSRVYTDADDELLAGILLAARMYVEDITGVALITQTLDYWLDFFPYGGLYPLRYTYGSPYVAMVPRYSYVFPSGDLSLPRPPLQSIVKLEYIADDGSTQLLDASQYQLDLVGIPGRVLPAYGCVWPVARAVPNAVHVQFTAGFGNNPKDVPEPLRQAIKVLAGTMYEHRELSVDSLQNEIPFVFKNLISRYRVFWLS